jgi:hypothetical protein
MADMADDHHHGEMDIHEQVSTYHAFLSFAKWGCLAMAVALVFLIVMFSTDAGFLASAVSAVVLLAIGIFFLREKPKPH